MNSSWVGDGGDVVDAGDGEHVEDDVGAGHVKHRQEVEEEAGELVADPAPALAVPDGEAGDEAAGVDGEAEGDDDGGHAPAVRRVPGEVQTCSTTCGGLQLWHWYDVFTLHNLRI